MTLPVPDLLTRLTGDATTAALLLYGSAGLVALLVLFILWQMIGLGPRRRRGLRRARQRLREGAWQDAFERVRKLRQIGSPSAGWKKRFNQFEAECLETASREALDDERYEEALDYDLQVARLLDKPEYEARASLQATMLAEVRRLFSEGMREGDTRPAAELIARTLQVQSPSREASFWQSLCDLRAGLSDQALANLEIARTGAARALSMNELDDQAASVNSGAASTTSPFLDPPLYLGAVLLRRSQPKEALRYLTEANRLDSSCPIVTLQLGAAMIDAGGDTTLAVRALQRALGPRGLGQWADNPQRAWVEAFPEKRSYVRKLAEKHPFVCPLWGADLRYLVRQGHLALAHGNFRLGNFQEAANLFDKVLKEGAPTRDVLRGLGLSLARLGRYDDAFKHLRTAHEMEQGQDRLTAGYLALCGACGTPASAEDRRQNIAWAVRTVAPFNAPGDAEWVGLLSRVFAEARQYDVPLDVDDQLYLCEHLVSVRAADAQAAGAFHHLAATHAHLLHPEYAWLYCRADQQHDVGGDHALHLYALTYADAAAARAFFDEQSWDFDAVEYAYLRRAAQLAPGRFPAPLGPAYPPRGEKLLLERAQALEQAGDLPAALEAMDVLARLEPDNAAALDQAAALHFRLGQLDQAHALLDQWHRLRPDDPLPLVRSAILFHRQDRGADSQERLRQALSLCTGQRRANVAFLGARLALQRFLAPASAEQPGEPAALATVEEFLQDCLAHDPHHTDALWLLAAVRWLQGDTVNLAAQAQRMDQPDAADPRFHYLAALCHLAGDDYAAALQASQRVQERSPAHAGRNGDATLDLALESRYLAGLAQVGLNDRPAAIGSLQPVAHTPGPTVELARALLGSVEFTEARHADAIRTWQTLDAAQRQAWNLAEPLATTTFITALEDLLAGRYEQAADQFRQAGRLGCRDRRLGPLLLLSLFKAGQQAIYGGETEPVQVTREGEAPAEPPR